MPEFLKEFQSDDWQRQDKTRIEGSQNPAAGINTLFKNILKCVEHRWDVVSDYLGAGSRNLGCNLLGAQALEYCADRRVKL